VLRYTNGTDDVTLELEAGADATTVPDVFFDGIIGSTTEEEGTDNYLGCVCPPGEFELQGTCMPCIIGTSCYEIDYDDLHSYYGVTVDTMDVEPGYWRPYHYSAHVFECVHAESCTNTSAETLNYGDGLCEEGHTGPYCDNCLTNETAGIQ
jgi:hypothetical protein